MRKLRVLVLVHEDLVPPETLEGVSDKEMMEWKTEYDVITALRELGHEVEPVGARDDLDVVRDPIRKWKPHVVFNLLEEFHGVAGYDQHMVGYLELMRQPYTGCNPRGLMLARDKALAKKLLAHHRIPTPRFAVYPRGRAVRPHKRLNYPLLVKSANEEASLGIARASIVHNDEKLAERVRFIHEHVQTDALVEEYIDGRELYVGVIGNLRLQTFPIWELLFTNLPDDVPHIATAKVKWDLAYQERYGIETVAARDLSPELERRIHRLCKRIHHLLYLSGYARMDLRLAPDGRLYVLEANPNPNLSYGEDFAESAEAAGIEYPELLQRIISTGLRYQAAWRD